MLSTGQLKPVEPNTHDCLTKLGLSLLKYVSCTSLLACAVAFDLAFLLALLLLQNIAVAVLVAVLVDERS